MEPMAVTEGDLLWTPTEAFKQRFDLTAYMTWLGERGHDFPDYEALRAWSVESLEAFWGSLWEYFEILSDTPYETVVAGAEMISARWYPGSRVNYAEHVLRPKPGIDPDATAIRHSTEIRPYAEMSWRELDLQVRRLARRLRASGIAPGDRVACFFPNVPETIIAMLATAAVGAVWASAAPEFGVKTVVDRYAQIEPKAIFVTDGYVFGGKRFDRREAAAEIISALPSLEQVIWLPYLGDLELPLATGHRVWTDLMAAGEDDTDPFEFERVPTDHPLWVLFSSGTTGLPKAIVHGHVGMLMEHLKSMRFHIGLRPGSAMFFYTTTGWMMWNSVVASLLAGATAILYDGSPVYPDIGALWGLAERARATVFGASPSLVQMMEKAEIRPSRDYDLSALECIILGGAPSTPETFAWLYEHVAHDLWVTSQSGGTELCSGLVGAAPILPVYAGEIQARLLGMDIESFNDAGEPVRDEVGELVVRKPFPSAPLGFWNDPENRRYRESYFETFPGIWRHGDLFKINQRGGCYVYGRSDATLNRFGVRIGTAEIYRTVEALDEIDDSLIVCCEDADGGYFMPLFVKMTADQPLDEVVIQRLTAALRTENSPRHVPDVVVVVPDIPYTLTGKKMEVPIRRILMGTPIEKAASRDIMRDPGLLAWYAEYARSR